MRWPLSPATGTVQLTTTGRRSGRAHRIEIWYVVLDGVVHLVGSPGPRDWLANLRAHPAATVHVRRPAAYDIDVTATEVTDPAARRALVPLIWAVQPWYRTKDGDIRRWVERSPMVALSPVHRP